MIGSAINAVLGFIFTVHFLVGFVIGAVGGYLVGLNRNRKTAKEELVVAQAWTQSQLETLRKRVEELIAKVKG